MLPFTIVSDSIQTCFLILQAAVCQ